MPRLKCNDLERCTVRPRLLRLVLIVLACGLTTIRGRLVVLVLLALIPALAYERLAPAAVNLGLADAAEAPQRQSEGNVR